MSRRPYLSDHDLSYPDPREGKLPAWAQDRLARGRQRVTSLEEQLQARQADTEITDIWYGEYDNKVYLPADTIGTPPVHFGMKGAGSRPFEEIQVRHCYDKYNRGALDINGGGPMVIELAGGSNNFRIRLKEG